MATHAFGTTLSWNGHVVAGLTAINGIEATVDVVDVTTHASSNSYKETLPGLIDPGDVTAEGYFVHTDSDGQLAMLTDMNSRTSRIVIITFPSATGATWTFTGFITALKIGDAPVDGAIPFTVTIKPTGKPVFAVATAAGLTTPFFTVSGAGTVIAPTAAGDVYEYIVNVANGVATVTVTPTAAAGVITVDGNTVLTGQASSSIALTAGAIKDVLIVVTETNKASRTYTLHMLRAAL
jgi:hypothetical protein